VWRTQQPLTLEMWPGAAAQKAEMSKKELNLLVEHQRQELEKLRKAAEVAQEKWQEGLSLEQAAGRLAVPRVKCFVT